MLLTFISEKSPDNGGYAIAAGLSEMIEFLEQLHFDKEDIDYLRSKNQFSEEFLQYLADFKFECDVYAVEEGTPVFPNEPRYGQRSGDTGSTA